MQGIVEIKDTLHKQTKGYYPIDDVNNIDEFLQKLKQENKRFSRDRNSKYYEAVLVETVEDANIALAKYIWPQLERVKYEDTCYKHDTQKISKRLRKAIDWLVVTFPEPEMSFVIDVDDENHIITTVCENGSFKEKYVFNGGKNPIERIVK